MSSGELLFVVTMIVLLAWADHQSRCDDCGETLKWADKRRDVPMVRCFTCDGPHPAYVRDGYHHLFTYEASDD